MNLKDLKYLVAVAEHQHFGKAAAACFVSQPTLSTQIRKLEATLGVALFERTNRQVLPTVIGREIVAQAERVLRAADQLVDLAATARDPFGGNLRVGIIPTVAPYLLPRIVPRMRTAYPDLTLSLVEAQTASLQQLLSSGEVDAVIVALPFEFDRVVSHELYREPFLLTVPETHKLAARPTARLADLQSESVLLLEDGHCLRDQALEVCNRAAAVENANFRATSLETLRQMVAAGVGITLTPALAVERGHGGRAEGLRDIPFSGECPSRTIGLVWRQSSARQHLLGEMAQLLEQPL